jgi:hypothetical protein
MAGRLVTVATFDQVAQAHIAKNALEDAGIKAMIADENTVGMLWSVATAIGGVKVQVLEEDAETALAVLERELGPDEALPDDPPELAEHDQLKSDEQPQPAEGQANTASQEEYPHTERDEYARRLFFMAWLGLVIFPVAFIAFYFLANALLGKGTLNPRSRFNTLVGGLVVLASFCIGPFIWCAPLLRILD